MGTGRSGLSQSGGRFDIAYQFGNVRYVYTNSKADEEDLIESNMARRLVYVTVTPSDNLKRVYYYNSSTKRIEVIDLRSGSGSTEREKEIAEKVERIWRDRHSKKKRGV